MARDDIRYVNRANETALRQHPCQVADTAQLIEIPQHLDQRTDPLLYGSRKWTRNELVALFRPLDDPASYVPSVIRQGCEK